MSTLLKLVQVCAYVIMSVSFALATLGFIESFAATRWAKAFTTRSLNALLVSAQIVLTAALYFAVDVAQVECWPVFSVRKVRFPVQTVPCEGSSPTRFATLQHAPPCMVAPRTGTHSSLTAVHSREAPLAKAIPYQPWHAAATHQHVSPVSQNPNNPYKTASLLNT